MRNLRRVPPCLLTLSACGLLIPGCFRGDDPLGKYRIENEHEEGRQLATLPVVLRLPDLRPGVQRRANTKEWFRLARENELVDKTIDDAIDVYGDNYIVSLFHTRKEPRMYYRLSGAYTSGVFGVVVLDKKLKIKAITTDPEF